MHFEKVKIFFPYLETRSELYEVVKYFKEMGATIEINTNKKYAVLFNLFLRFFVLFVSLLADKRKIKANYRVINEFKNARLRGLKFFKENVLLELRLLFGRFGKLDNYLPVIKSNSKTDANELYLFSTEIESLKDYLVALMEEKKVVVYVYSWDHIYKNIFYSNRVFLYLVWDDEQKDELVSIHNIDENKIKVIGSSAFHHIYNFKNRKKKQKSDSSVLVSRKVKRKKALLAMATGIEQLAKEELHLFESLVKLNEKIDFSLRPYPFLNKNINFDNFFELKNFEMVYKPEVLTSENVIDFHKAKLQQVEQHDYVIHIGTTLGLEASLLNKKSVLLYPTVSSFLGDFVLQRQIVLLAKRSKVILTELELPDHLTAFIISNKDIKKRFVLKSIKSFSKSLYCNAAT